VIKSDVLNSSSNDTIVTINCFGAFGGYKRVKSNNLHLHSLGAARDGGADIAKPMMPMVLFLTSTPVYLLFSHCPPLSEAFACGIWRASDIIKPIVCSAAEIVLPVGALTTIIPRWVAA